MDTKNRTSLILAIIAGVLVVITAAFLILSTSVGKNEPEVTEPPTVAPTEPPTQAPTEEPTLPPPDPNPYGELDFQYDGRFLKLIEGECMVGIDVSSWQYDIDWREVANAGAQFAMIRIGYRGSESGRINADKYAQQNLAGAAEAGLHVGVYFFSQALTREEAEEEAYYVLETIKDLNIAMPVVFDWEKVENEESRSVDMDRRTLTDCALTFLETIELAGYDAMVYFNPYQSRTLFYLPELKDYDFWLASYTDRMDFPYKVKMWQYTDSGSIPGIDTPCDFNIYFPDETDYEITGVS